MLLSRIANAIIAMDRVPDLDQRRGEVRRLLPNLDQLAADERVHVDTRCNLLCKVARHLDPAAPRLEPPAAGLAQVRELLDGPTPPVTPSARNLAERLGDALADYCLRLGLDPTLIRPYGAAAAIIRELPGLTVVPMPRPNTPDRRGDNGTTILRTKRACNGCGGTLGDATDQELQSAMNGEHPADVRGECPRCTPPAWPAAPTPRLTADAAYDNLVAAVRDEMDDDEDVDPVASDLVLLWGLIAPVLPDFAAATKAVLAAGYERLPGAKPRPLSNVMADAHIHGRGSAVAAAIMYAGWARTPGQEMGDARDTRISEVLTEKDPAW